MKNFRDIENVIPSQAIQGEFPELELRT